MQPLGLAHRVRNLPSYANSFEAVKYLLRAALKLELSQRIHIGSIARDLEYDDRWVATLQLSGVSALMPDSGPDGQKLSEWEIVIRAQKGCVNDDSENLYIIIDTHFRDFTPLNSIVDRAKGWDLVAVTGLGGHAFGSWKQRNGDYMWLRDGITHEKSLEGVRVILYGYDSATVNSQSFQNLHHIALTFKRRLKRIRRSCPRPNWPLVLLGHSLGGLVIKQALIQIAGGVQADVKEVDILQAIRSLIFFGVPSQGMSIESLMAMVEGQPNLSLIQSLDRNSPDLVSQHHEFCKAFPFRDSKIFSFFETEVSPTAIKKDGKWMMRGPSEVLVDIQSATQSRGSWESSQQYHQPIPRNHSNMVKYGREDECYRLVMERLEDVVETTIYTVRAIPERSLENPDSDHSVPAMNQGNAQITNLEFTNIDQAIMTSLAFPQMFERKANIEVPHRRTCQWILALAEYKTWKLQSGGLLWIKGKPGVGKSTLMSFLFDQIKERHSTDTGMIILEFFFSARGEELQHNPIGMLRSLLSALFRQNPGIRDILRGPYKEKTDMFGKDPGGWTWQKIELEKLFLKAVLMAAQRASRSQQVIIFIDALDEAGEKAAQGLARFFHDLNTAALEAGASVKTCISCRHYPVASRFKGIEVVVEDHNKDDIIAFVHQRLTEQGSEEPEAWISVRNNVIDRAHGIFQWVRLVVPRIEECIIAGEPPSVAHQLLDSIPDELNGIYKHIIGGLISSKHRSLSTRLIRWVLIAERPLTVDDMQAAMILSDTVTASSTGDCLVDQELVSSNPTFERQIHTWSGGLLEIVSVSNKDDTHLGGEEQKMVQIIQVIHQSVNDFFRDSGLQLLQDVAMKQPQFSFQCHGALYRCCLNRMTLQAVSSNEQPARSRYTKEEIPRGIQHVHSLNKEQAHRLLSSRALSDYALNFMLTHAEKARGSRQIQLDLEVHIMQKILRLWHEELWGVVMHEPDVWYSSESGLHLMHIAAAHNLSDLVKYLMQSEDNIKARDRQDFTAVHFAARNGHIDILRLLSDAGADIHAVAEYGQTSLTLAARSGHLGVVEWLVDRNVRIDTNKNTKHNALRDAAEGGHLEVVRVLLAAGADVNAESSEHGSALVVASRQGYGAIVQRLLEEKPDLHLVGWSYGSALSNASGDGEERLVQMLLDAGADPNFVPPELAVSGTRVALLEASSNGHETIVKMLLDAGADVNLVAGERGTALQIASSRGHEIVVRMLLDAGADVNLRAPEFRTDYGADSSWRPYETALQAASTAGYGTIVRILLDAGADVHAPGRYGPALLDAARYDFGMIVQMLLDAGADVNAGGGMHGTALEGTLFRGLDIVAQMLVNAGAKMPEWLARAEDESQIDGCIEEWDSNWIYRENRIACCHKIWRIYQGLESLDYIDPDSCHNPVAGHDQAKIRHGTQPYQTPQPHRCSYDHTVQALKQ